MGEYERIYKADLTDRHLMAFWQRVLAEGKGRRLGYNVPPLDGPAFVRWMRQPDVFPWIVFFRGTPAGLFLLTGKEGKTAHCHFSMLHLGTARTADSGMGRFPAPVGAGLYALASALWERGEDGLFLLDTLIGMTPRSFADAEKFIRRLHGMSTVIRRYCYLHDEDRNDDSLVTVWHRSLIEEKYRHL